MSGGAITDFAWSPQFKQIAVLRGAWRHDVALVNNFAAALNSR